MRAYIEYPQISDDRIQVTRSEFVVETKEHLRGRIAEELAESVEAVEQSRAYWDERMEREDI